MQAATGRQAFSDRTHISHCFACKLYRRMRQLRLRCLVPCERAMPRHTSANPRLTDLYSALLLLPLLLRRIFPVPKKETFCRHQEYSRIPVARVFMTEWFATRFSLSETRLRSSDEKEENTEIGDAAQRGACSDAQFECQLRG